MYKSIFFFFIILLLSTSCTTQPNSSKKFDTLMEILDKEYIQELNSSKITDDAIQKVLSKLDAHSLYLDSHDLESYLITTKGNYGGIGISMYLKKSILTIMHTYPGSPAQRAGILPGDIILKINNYPTLGLSLNACSNLAKGKIGEILKLTIIRHSRKRPLLFSIKREQIKTDPLKSKEFVPNILYVKIPIFNNNASKELKRIVHQHTHVQGIIVDLRSNPGGILDEAVSIVDMFLDKGLIVSQKGRNKSHTKAFMAHTQLSDMHTPIAILIDAYSASASEIVAGALKVHKRATIIGEKSYGKGTVQSLFSLSHNSAVKLTIAKYYLPDGTCIDKIGIVPDIYVKSKHTLTKNTKALSEQQLKHILKRLDKGTLQAKLQKGMRDKANTPKKITMDKTIKNALQLLVEMHTKH